MESSPNATTPEPSYAPRSAFSTPLRNANESPTGSMYERLTECIHRLRDDLVIFRDPQVRSHLETIPIQSSLSHPAPQPLSNSPSRESLAQHLATILSLRTTLVEAEAALKDAREADLANRKRAARAEGKLAELQAQQDTNERSQSDAVDAAAARIRAVESEASNAIQKARSEASQLSQRVSSLNAKAATWKEDADTFKAAAKKFEIRAKAAESELNTVKQAFEVRERVSKLEMETIKERERRLLEEATIHNTSSRKSEEGSNNALRDERRRADLLEQQAVQLKSEVQWMSEKVARSAEDLHKAEVLVSKLREQVERTEHAEKEAEELRKCIVNLEQVERESRIVNEEVRALTKEKKELRKLICELVPSRDVKEGVDLLRRLANKDGSGMSGDNDASLLNEVESLRKKCKELEEKVTSQDAGEVHTETVTSSLSTRVQELLQKDAKPQAESSESKGVSENKDEDNDVEMEDSSSTSTLLVEYREMLKEMDGVIGSHESEIERLKTELMSKKEAAETSVAEGEPDFDRKVTKVVHLTENPLRNAITLYRAEQQNLCARKRMRGSEDSENVISKQDADKLREEMDEMRAEYDDLKRRAVLGDRTKQVALKRIEEVRSAVYNLFGWSMKVNGTMYRLSSIYAESPDEVLHFCVNEEGSMSLIDSDYAQKLNRELEQFVVRMNSFPALLAHITSENFEKTTAFMS